MPFLSHTAKAKKFHIFFFLRFYFLIYSKLQQENIIHLFVKPYNTTYSIILSPFILRCSKCFFCYQEKRVKRT